MKKMALSCARCAQRRCSVMFHLREKFGQAVSLTAVEFCDQSCILCKNSGKWAASGSEKESCAVMISDEEAPEQSLGKSLGICNCMIRIRLVTLFWLR